MRCPNCKTLTGAPEWNARATILWANGHGTGHRVFCDVCGQWSDIKVLKGIETIRVVRKPNNTKDESNDN